ncbi:hypothetical protein IRJ41_006579 [Triplophysa rosa]|uniref:Uncharacterized protein n=1 Tax=Triplophysa rosa TaxID=992332 RepID=A0A9W7WSK7_TRIRA|nr:hypothetical protein IRJ41_006579 [Triplophysa rosa]
MAHHGSAATVDSEEETVSTAITCTQCDLQAATLRERVWSTSITLPPDPRTNHRNGSFIQQWRLLEMPSINRKEENKLTDRSLNKTVGFNKDFELLTSRKSSQTSSKEALNGIEQSGGYTGSFPHAMLTEEATHASLCNRGFLGPYALMGAEDVG